MAYCLGCKMETKLFIQCFILGFKLLDKEKKIKIRFAVRL